MTGMRILGPCPTTWSFGGWRAWYDRILYGHVGHHCNLHEHEGHHTCDCGARCEGFISRGAPLATPTPHRGCTHSCDYPACQMQGEECSAT
jgi:hypothetical protein